MGILPGVLRFVIFLNLSLALVAIQGCGSAGQSTGRISEGESAGIVEFALKTLDGRVVRPSDYRPQAVLITYFATWCTPCLDELPALDSLDRALDDLTVIAVNIDTDPVMLLPSFLELVPVTFPVVLADAATLDGKSPFGHLKAIPASYLLDGSGMHVQTFLGPTPIDYLHRKVMALAEETR